MKRIIRCTFRAATCTTGTKSGRTRRPTLRRFIQFRPRSNSPGGPDDDRGGRFDRGGWTAAYGDEEGWQSLTSWFEHADAFLLGRKAWEIWEYWPLHDRGRSVSHGIYVLPSYVPSPRSRTRRGKTPL